MGTLSKIPVEVRQMIFELCLKDTWNGTAPALLAALRAPPETKLYFEALEVFQKTNEYILGESSFESFVKMPVHILFTIKKMKISFRQLRSFMESLGKVQGSFESLQNLTELRISYGSHIRNSELRWIIITLFDWIEEIIPQCRRLTSLTISKPLSNFLRPPVRVPTPEELQQPGFWLSPFLELNYCLGMEATRLLERGILVNFTQLQWQAKQGSTLRWRKKSFSGKPFW